MRWDIDPLLITITAPPTNQHKLLAKFVPVISKYCNRKLLPIGNSQVPTLAWFVAYFLLRCITELPNGAIVFYQETTSRASIAAVVNCDSVLLPTDGGAKLRRPLDMSCKTPCFYKNQRRVLLDRSHLSLLIQQIHKSNYKSNSHFSQ